MIQFNEPTAPCLTDPAGLLCAAVVPLTRGWFSVISEADEEAVSPHKWTYHRTGYAVRCVPRDGQGIGRGPQRMILMHRDILGAGAGEVVDHHNGRRHDNRRGNIRIVTRSQNQQNRQSNRANKSGYQGVHWCKQDKKWKAAIRVGGKKVHLGYHVTAEAAAEAYNRAAVKHFGERAKLSPLPRAEPS